MSITDLKKTIHAAVESSDLDAVAVLGEKDRKAISILMGMASGKETITAWRTVKARVTEQRCLFRLDSVVRFP